MTRKEEIKNASIEYTLKNRPNCICGDAFAEMTDELNRNPAFEEGAKWADMYPVNVWHDASEEPKINEDVVLYDCCGNFIAEFFDGSVTWRNIVLYYKATMWAYADDLLPKGGEQ